MRSPKINIKDMDSLRASIASDIEKRRKEGPKGPTNLREVIAGLHDVILTMRADGWTDSDIAYALTARGVKISKFSVSRYMQRLSAKPRGKTAKKPTVAVQASPDSVEATRARESEPDETEKTAPHVPSMAGFSSRKPRDDA